MPGIISSRTRRLYQRPPAPPFALNWDSPQSRGLIAWWPLGEANHRNYCSFARNNFALTNNGTTIAVKPVPQHGGYGASSDGTNTSWLDMAGVPIAAYPGTLSTWAIHNNTTTTSSLLCLMASSSVYWAIGGDGNNEYGFADGAYADPSGAGNAAGSNTVTYTAGEPALFTGVFVSTTSRTAYLNGINPGTDTGSRAFSAPTRTSLLGFRFSGTTAAGPLNGTQWDSRVYDVALTADEVWLLYDPRTRFELYYPLGMKTYSFSPPAAGGADAVPQCWAQYRRRHG